MKKIIANYLVKLLHHADPKLLKPLVNKAATDLLYSAVCNPIEDEPALFI
jgi:hypothetical protein